MKKRFLIGLTAVLLALSQQADAQDLDRPLKWYKPSNVHLQYAGNLGMISAGPSWSFWKKRIDFEFSLGYVPKLEASKPIYLSAIKVMYTPKLQFDVKKVRVSPVSIGLAATYTFGERFSKYRDSRRFPEGYAWWNTQYRFGLVYQAEAYTSVNFHQIKGVSLYLEASLWDLDLYSYKELSDDLHVSLWNITNLGLGTRVFF